MCRHGSCRCQKRRYISKLHDARLDTGAQPTRPMTHTDTDMLFSAQVFPRPCPRPRASGSGRATEGQVQGNLTHRFLQRGKPRLPLQRDVSLLAKVGSHETANQLPPVRCLLHVRRGGRRNTRLHKEKNKGAPTKPRQRRAPGSDCHSQSKGNQT